MPDLYQRQATDVQAMQLGDPADLHLAEVWLRAHGLASDVRRVGRAYTPDDAPARRSPVTTPRMLTA